MKVIDGNFGKDTEDKMNLSEALDDALGQAELKEVDSGQFFMVVNTHDRFTFITNEKNLGELVALLEVAKGTLLQQFMETL